jgi:hypothetical protein
VRREKPNKQRRNTMTRGTSIRLGALGLILALASLGAARENVGKGFFPGKIIIKAKISVPGTISASCPYTVKFKGQIEANGPCTVKFKFIRSDGALKPPQTLTFSAAGAKTVTDAWTLGASTTGWEAIQILAPVSAVSNHGDFVLACLSAPAKITDVHLFCGGSPCREIDLVGTNFGAVQGTRKVLVDGVAHTGAYHWGDTGITLFLSSPVIFWDHVYQFVVCDGTTPISNVYSTRFRIKFDGVVPSSGTPGTLVTINAWGGGSPADGRVVKIGTATCPVVSWTTTAEAAQIKVNVPAIPAGSYKIYIQRGADIISEQYNFTVL